MVLDISLRIHELGNQQTDLFKVSEPLIRNHLEWSLLLREAMLRMEHLAGGLWNHFVEFSGSTPRLK